MTSAHAARVHASAAKTCSSVFLMASIVSSSPTQSGVSKQSKGVQQAESSYIFRIPPPPVSSSVFWSIQNPRIFPKGMQITSLTQLARVDGEGKGEGRRMDFFQVPPPLSKLFLLQKPRDDWIFMTAVWQKLTSSAQSTTTKSIC